MTASSARMKWAISIISHGHGSCVLGIINDVCQELAEQDFHIFLTQNIPEHDDVLALLPESVQAKVSLIKNASPKGFGENHNAALHDLDAEFILAADPDLRLPVTIFPALEAHLAQANNGVASPRALTPQGQVEDNGRPLFTPWQFLRRHALGRRRNTSRNVEKHSGKVDWLAGLFLAMRQSTFQQINGFDTGYFMYCEDIDICLRVQQRGLNCTLLNDIKVIHPPRRGTFRSIRHLAWHIQSLFRLWRSPAYKQFRQRAKTGL
ncbi:MAG: galactosyltransferase-related protein [Oceanococcus sp.]